MAAFLAPALGGTLDLCLPLEAQPAQGEPHLRRRNDSLSSRTPWEMGVEIFNNSLTKDESKKLSLDSCPQASLESFLLQVTSARDDAKRKRSKTLERIDFILEKLDLFRNPIDALSQTNQEFMFAWGTMKFLMQVVLSEKQAIDKLADAIADVLQIFGRCEQYTELFGQHEKLTETIGILYGDVLNLLVRATRFYEKNDLSEVISSTPVPALILS